MKKYLLIFMLLMSTNLHAQRVDKPNESYDSYCVITLDRADVAIEIRNMKWRIWENEKALVFTDALIALNYMAKRGWELVAATNQMFVLKKRVTSDKEVIEGLDLRSITSFGKKASDVFK